MEGWSFADDEHADNTREVLREHTQILGAHLGAFPGPTAVRLDMQPISCAMRDAFMRVAQDVRRVWREDTMEPVGSDEAQRSNQVWASLEHVLCSIPALKRIEFVLWESQTGVGDALTEEAKVALKSALDGRPPRLGQSGTLQLVLESFV